MKLTSLPFLLKEISDPPQELYIRGNFPQEKDCVFLTVVGSRNYTAYGEGVCRELIKGLKDYPFVIISGLAIGIDTIALTTALDTQLPCIAVPGSGLDDEVLYPKQNHKLAHRIINQGGCLLSEYPDDFKATKWSFPKRNRIMAGLSHAVLVIEAENISGTRITARLATEYNREVFAVPGSVFNTTSEGCHNLISEGAMLVSSAQDILDYFGFDKE
jgi:DNA processing protein